MSFNRPDVDGRANDGPPSQLDAPRCAWPAPPDDFVLQPNEVHIWCAAPGSFTHHSSRFRSIISAAEVDRAARFHSPVDCSNYVIRHGILRLILSRYLQQDPAGIEILSGYRGKPELKTAHLHFNQSHSADLALFAITAIGPVGVDIECVKPIPEFEYIASQYFCQSEVEMMRALAPAQRMKAFYSCWTSKEAYLKATGEGIGRSLNKVEVALDSDLQPRAIRFLEDPVISAWHLSAFSPAPGFLAAAALKGPVSSFQLWQVPQFLPALH